MARDGTNMLDLSMENNTINNQNIAGVTKKNKTQRSQDKKRTTKFDSDLEIVGQLSGNSDGLKFKKDSKLPELELESNLKTSVESSEDDLDSDLDRCKVLLVQNGSEKKWVETVTNKLKKVNKNEKPHKKEVRDQKENDKPLAEKGSDAPKGKPRKSVRILDEQIKENEQARLALLEQARKCVETSESSEDDLEIEVPKCKANQKKKRFSKRSKLRQTINKVCSKLDDEHDRCEALVKRKQQVAKFYVGWYLRR